MPKKTQRGDPLVSPGIVCYAEKKEKPFRFSYIRIALNPVWPVLLSKVLLYCSKVVCGLPKLKGRTFGRTILDTSGVSKKP